MLNDTNYEFLGLILQKFKILKGSAMNDLLAGKKSIKILYIEVPLKCY